MGEKKGRGNEQKGKKPLRDSGAVCVFMCEKEKRQRRKKGEGKVTNKAKVTFANPLTLCASH